MNPTMTSGSVGGPGGDEGTRLLVAARSDPEAFAAFYALTAERVVAYFYRRILCPYTSTDLMAETFARAYEHRRRFDPAGGSAIAWVFGIAGNLYLGWLRTASVGNRARRRLRLETPVLLDEDLERIESLVDLMPFRSALKAALEDLSPNVRAAVVLRVAEDKPFDEVAEILGCSIGAARVRVSRGVAQLIRRMEAG
jgi:RNA polymerase sigma factor (sigma-70 family)